jgi:hypothetical protein
MKKLITLLIAGVIMLAACGNPYDSDILSKYTKAESGLLYTNLVDEDVQNEVREALLGAGADKTAVEDVFEWIRHYNDIAKDSLMPLVPNFTQIDKNFIDYEYHYPTGIVWEENVTYPDVNCHTTAFYILRPFISVKNPLPEEDQPYDWSHVELFEEHPGINLTQNEIERFFNLYIGASKETDNVSEKEMYEAVFAVWSERGVSFKESKLSLISTWNYTNDFIYIGHSAVLAEYNGGLLLFEKVNPMNHYQASIFNNLTEVRAYMLDQMHSLYPEYNFFVLHNDTLME